MSKDPSQLLGGRFVVAALYKFVIIEQPELLRDEILALCRREQLLGTVLLAHEGINATVAGSAPAIGRLRAWLAKRPAFAGLQWKQSKTSVQPFLRLKVRLKSEIVTMGVAEIDPKRLVGTYVEPGDWNALISDPDVLVIDTRNKYEHHLGTFDGAVDPQTDSFREFPAYVERALDAGRDRKIAMFCTGGIRCEKATAYLKQEGFDQVYHLQGGILKYLEEVPREQSLWRGECFVFDDRVTVDHDLSPSAREVCPNCRMPVTEADKTSPEYEANVSCKFCFDRVTEARRASLKERQRQQRLASERRTSDPARDQSR